MRLLDVIRIADEAYGDGLVMDYYSYPGLDFGDSLAKFITEEIKDTYSETLSDDDKLLTASEAINKAALQLMDVSYKLCGVREDHIVDTILEEESKTTSQNEL